MSSIVQFMYELQNAHEHWVAKDLTAENWSDNSNDHLSSSILSFQHILQDNPEHPKNFNSYHSDGSNNEDTLEFHYRHFTIYSNSV